MSKILYCGVERLNPYYTGIHLHTKKELQRLTEKRLNPYYTGIHLHIMMKQRTP